jgi:poly-gamma-glutamate capsule biosynthesis protein CapA/YwtB (metallophosphatase superfamily)
VQVRGAVWSTWRRPLVVALALALAAGPLQVVAGTAPRAEAATGVVRLMAVGDVMLAQSIGRRIVRKGIHVPFQRVLPIFSQADLLVANLECAISKRGTRADKRFTFRAPLRAADSLSYAGIDVVSLANNHSLDWGVPALRDTMRLLDERGIARAGAGENSTQARAPAIVTRNGLRIGFLGYVRRMGESRTTFNTIMWEAGPSKPGVAISRPAEVARDVAAARQKADIVVVMLHAGREYNGSPGSHQRNVARAAIEAGASLVIGHHPHVLQGYERRQNTLIAYSLGNFVFDLFEGAPNDTAILDVTLDRTGVVSLRWVPILIVNGLPRPAPDTDVNRILRRIPDLSPSPTPTPTPTSARASGRLGALLDFR